MKKIILLSSCVFVISFLAIFPPLYAPHAFSGETPESLIKKRLVTEGVKYQSFIVNVREIGQEELGKDMMYRFMNIMIKKL
jgi:hypothetical protein